MKNKKASIMDMFVWLIVLLVLTVLVGAFLYANFTIQNVFAGQTTDLTPRENTSLADFSAPLFAGYNGLVNTLKYSMIALVFGMILSIFISNKLQQSSPVAFGIYVMVSIGAFIVSVYISNIYNTNILTDPTLQPYLLSLGITHYLLQYLPVVTFIIGVLGGVFLALNNQEEGGSGTL